MKLQEVVFRDTETICAKDLILGMVVVYSNCIGMVKCIKNNTFSKSSIHLTIEKVDAFPRSIIFDQIVNSKRIFKIPQRIFRLINDKCV